MLLEQLKALADPTRLTLVAVLYEYELTVNELVRVMEMGQSRISRHLKILSDAKLLSNRRDGLFIYYYLKEDETNAICFQLKERILSFLTDELHGRCQEALEERRERTRSFFNTIADQWTELRREIIGNLDIHSVVLSMLDSCEISKVADLGCGNGDLSEKLFEKYERVIGVDNSPEMIKLAQNRFSGPAPDFRIGAIEHLPMRDNEVDCCILTLVLHHVSDPEAALHEIHRTIREGGCFVLVDFDRHENRTLHQKYGDRWPGFSKHELESLFGNSSFSIQNHTALKISDSLNMHIYLTQKISKSTKENL